MLLSQAFYETPRDQLSQARDDRSGLGLEPGSTSCDEAHAARGCPRHLGDDARSTACSP